MARVIKWEEWNPGPFCPSTMWSVTVEMLAPSEDESEGSNSIDDGAAANFTQGDLVRLHGLQSEKARVHNEQIGTVFKLVESVGRYGVTYLRDGDGANKKKKESVACRPENKGYSVPVD